MREQTSEAVLPDEDVAQQIIEQLSENRLISQQIVDDLLRQLLNGSFKVEDWRLFAEKTLEFEKRAGDDDEQS